MNGHTWLVLRWPHEVTADQVRTALLGLHGLSTPQRRDAFVIRVVGDAQGIHHYLAVPTERRQAVVSALRHAIPGIAVEPAEVVPQGDEVRWAIWTSTRRRPLRLEDSEIVSGGILAALSGLQRDESISLTWIIGPVRRPIAVPSRTPADRNRSAASILAGPFAGVGQLDAEARTALIKKQGEPGWRAAGHIAVHAASDQRRRQLLGRLSGALRVSQGAGVQLGAHRAWFAHPGRLPWRRPLALNVAELTGLAAWPSGSLEILPLDRVANRLVLVPRHVPRTGLVLGVSPYGGSERPVAMTTEAARSGTWLIGPTGTGKTTVLASLAAQSMALGNGMVVVDPKGDLAQACLSQVPPHRLDDVVVLDVAEDADRVVAFNPLSGSERNPELLADQLLFLFRSLSGEAWGVRIAEVLDLGLRSLAHLPGSSLVALPVLLSDAAYRRHLVARLDDPFLRAAWASFEALSPSERQQAVAPVARRLRELVLPKRMRAVLGQASPRFRVEQVITERKILVVNLARGTVGPTASSLLGSMVMNAVYQHLLGRANIPAERRETVTILIDEVHEHVRGISDLADALTQIRAFGGALAAANQHARQLDPGVLAALSANARNRIVFQTSAEDATYFTKGQSVLRPEDFMRLPPYHAYARVLAGGSVTPYLSLRTLPLPAPISDPAEVRARSRQRYGVDREQVEAELRTLLGGNANTAGAPLGGRRRPV